MMHRKSEKVTRLEAKEQGSSYTIMVWVGREKVWR